MLMTERRMLVAGGGGPGGWGEVEEKMGLGLTD